MEFNFQVEADPQRLDIWLSVQWMQNEEVKSQDISCSRTQIKKLAEEGRIKINGRAAKASEKVKIGDQISVTLDAPSTVDIVAQPIPLEILYEDQDILVINKPAGMVVHPAAGDPNGTLVNALLGKYGNQLSNINGEIRPGIVHRIDKDTSGVLVIARNNTAHTRLSEMFKVHHIRRVYVALVEGVVKASKGSVDAPIGRHPSDRKKMSVLAKHARTAITHFEVIKRFKQGTLLECTLETGRTHQIRVHLAYIGHPVAGDPVYGRRNGLIQRKGQLLHAKILGFEHPITNQYLEFESPLPSYFDEIIKNLSLL